MTSNAWDSNEETRPWNIQPVEPIAEVASTTGVVQARSLEGALRTLAVGDSVYLGERVSTAPGSNAGLWLGDVLAQLEANSRVLLEAAPQRSVSVTLEGGAVRIVDSRVSGPPIQLHALGASTQIVGGDREARILLEKTGPFAMFSDWAQPFSVRRGSEVVDAGPGESIVANNREPLFATAGHPERIDLLEGAPSLADAGPATDVAELLGTAPVLPSVSAGPGGAQGGVSGGAIMAVPGLPLQLRSPCGTIRRECAGGVGASGPRPPTIIIEKPPTTTPFPGANNAGQPPVEQPPTTGGFPGANNTPTP